MVQLLFQVLQQTFTYDLKATLDLGKASLIRLLDLSKLPLSLSKDFVLDFQHCYFANTNYYTPFL